MSVPTSRPSSLSILSPTGSVDSLISPGTPSSKFRFLSPGAEDLCPSPNSAIKVIATLWERRGILWLDFIFHRQHQMESLKDSPTLSDTLVQQLLSTSRK